jgi:hypothetical protein
MFMRVWPANVEAVSSLSGSEGALVSISISVDPRQLESLLETLAQVSFPINPQIYHDAVVVYVYPDQREQRESTTIVEFPAYGGRLDEVTQALQANGFDSASIQVTGMLDDIHSASLREPAPAGAPYVARYHLKQRAAAVH